jgi:hypothetical protein
MTEAYLTITKMDNRLDWQLDQPIKERGPTSAYCQREQLAIAPHLIEFGVNSRSIRHDLSSVLNLAAPSSCLFRLSCGFSGWTAQ